MCQNISSLTKNDHPGTFYCDIVVVGAGPGGSMAAKYAALGGLKTILIEKKAEIGSPLRCAEGVSKKWLAEIGVEPDPAWICTEIMSMKIVSPSGATLRSDEREEDGSGRGYILERHLFDKALARQAAEAGAKIMMRTACRDVIRKDGKLVGIKADCMGEPIEIYAKCIVAADGFESQVPRWAGLDTSLQAKDIDTCIQYRMTDVDVEQDACEFVIGSAASGGYIWIFPKGGRTANIGIGIQASKCEMGADPKHYLDKHIENDPRLKNGQILEIVGGGVSTSISDISFDDNIIVVGDSARFMNPLTGGGVHEACISGMFAGKILADCAKKDDFSREALSIYKALWDAETGKRFRRNYRIKEWFANASDEKLDRVIGIVSKIGLKKIKMDKIITILAENEPAILKDLGLM